MTMTTNDNVLEGDVVPPSSEMSGEQPQPQPQPMMEDGGNIDNVNGASIDGEPPMQEFEEGGQVDDNLVVVDWGMVFTFFGKQ